MPIGPCERRFLLPFTGSHKKLGVQLATANSKYPFVILCLLWRISFVPFVANQREMSAPLVMTRRPKILHTMTWLAPGGGADRNVYLSMKAMRRDYEIHLAVGRQIERGDLLKLPGVSAHICPHLDREIRPWRDLRALMWFARLIRRERFDLVHTHESKASLLGRLAARWAGCKRVIYGLHGVVFNEPGTRLQRQFYIALEKTTIWACDLIIAVGRDALRHYRRQKIGRGIPQRVVYSGIDVADFERRLREVQRDAFRRELGIPQRAPVLVNIGRFSRAKAQRYAIAAFAKLRTSHARLLLVGEGDERAACERLCRELGVADRVIFAGFLRDVAPAYAIASVHLSSSLREGLPGVAVEASLARLPTVSFEVEGIREIATDGQSGFVVPQGDIAGMAERLEMLLCDAEMRGAFGNRAYEHAIARWDHRAMVRELDAIYRREIAR